MRIYLDGRTLQARFPGIGRYTWGLWTGLEAREDVEAVLLVDPRRPPGPFPWDRARRRLEAPWSPFSLTQQWALPRLLRGQPPGLYHSSYYLMPYRPPWPVVLTVYDLIPLRFPALYPFRVRVLYRLFHRLALGRADRVVALSEAGRRELEAAFPGIRGRIAVHPPGVEPAFRPLSPAERTPVLARYGLEDGGYVLYLGSNKPHKNLVGLVEAWRRVDRPEPLVIAGAWDPRFPEARRRAEPLGDRIRFLGPVPEGDLPALYGGARLFVFPSLWEGFGLPVLEAMACATAVLCSDLPSLREVAEGAARFVPPGDWEALAAALTGLLADGTALEALARAGLERARAFRWDRRVDRLVEEVYRPLWAERLGP